MPAVMTVDSLAFDPGSKSPLLVLKEKDGERQLILSIGLVEASAIAAALEEVETNRPMTHDLLAQVMDMVGANLLRVEIHDLEEDTFIGNLVITHGDEIMIVDCRPSDGITMALKVGAELLVHEQVFEKAGVSKVITTQGKTDEDILTNILEEMDDDDFGKYKM